MQCLEQGSATSCHSLAEYYQLLKGDAQEALRLFAKNCDPPADANSKRYSPSCFSAASLLVGKDNALAISYFEKACASGSAEGCYNLGVIFRRGTHGFAPNLEKASGFYEQGCSGGHARSCFGKAVLLMNAQKNAEALHYFEKACLLGFPYGCSNAVVMLTTGDGVEKDLERADRLKELGTELGRAMGIEIKKD